jgi:choline dehydrogenase-like flavoprotein
MATTSERLPILDASTNHDSRIQLTVDAVVVGSGAGGAVMAYELAAAGKSVVVLEAGRYVPSAEFTEMYADMFEKIYADRGGQTTATGDMVVLQGKCVGGSTVVNGAACFRTPDNILKRWGSEFGLTDLSTERLAPYFELVEKRLSVHVNTTAEINRNSQLMDAGCKKLGYSSKPVSRNIKDCALTGFCLAGCATDRKQSMLVTYIPWAIAKGARVIADTTVEKVLLENGMAAGVQGVMHDPATGAKVADVEIRAKITVLSAGAVQTPILLQKNELANRSGMVGKNFACHPSLGILGMFEEEVFGYRGATIGSYCDEFESAEKGGFILEGGNAGADFLAILAPGFGQQNLDFMKKFNHVAGMVTLIHDQNSGTVTWDDGLKKIDWELNELDKPSIRKALEAGARIFFAAGAKEVYFPTFGPTVVRSAEEIPRVIAGMTLEPNTLRLTSYHPQGTCRMGADPKTSVVAPNGETHDIKNLYVADASLFPTSIMVNPQMTVYALSTYIAEGILKAMG